MRSHWLTMVAFIGVFFFGVDGAAQTPRFESVVAPLLVERCIDCHSGAKPKGKLDLTRKESAEKTIVPKSAKDSVLWQRIESGEMPPKKPLSDAEKVIVKAWIDGGAIWGSDPIDPFRVTTTKRAGNDWWALQPVKRPAVPKGKHAIDHFVIAKLQAEGLTPSPETDPRTLIRRLHFDLTGLPPTPEEINAFVKDWNSALSTQHSALVNHVNALLASPHYGERWARHWLDVVRFGESNGFEHDELRRNAWPYRDWVIDAFNKDMPYSEFARMQIAGDILKADDPTAITATGFLVAGGYDLVGQAQQSVAMKAVVRQDELEDIVGTIGQTFLGLTVQCARCHDHKFDPVRMDEYYHLTAAVAGVRHGERDITSPQARLAFEKKRAEAQRQIDDLRAALTKLEQPIRAKILASRTKREKTPIEHLPKPIARWDFTKSAKDDIAGFEAKLHNGAALKPDGLYLSGNAYASTPPLTKAIHAKTLSAVVQLANVQQRGGAALSVQSLDGGLFDAIVFAEREPGRWIAGSNFFARTQDFGGAAETDTKPLHVAIAYHQDGTITAYRNGTLHGKPYKTKNLQSFNANQSMLLFGLRHSPAGGGKHLAGTIVRAELFDRALSADEVAATAGGRSDFVGEAEIVRAMTDLEKGKRSELLRLIEQAGAKQIPPPSTKVYAATPRAPETMYVLHRGNPGEKLAVALPGGVAALKLNADFGLKADANDGERRRKLAAWITDANNPLFARVMVNRLWHYHFGVGLVDTPSDFGFNGGRPSHPELLDWLADEFVQCGYSMKHMHRLIVTSAAYRQSSRFRPDAAKRDASNRWLWRKAPTRLEAEALRDSILTVAGQLNPQQGGPGYQDFKLTVRGATHQYHPIDTDDAALYRRSIYRTWARSGRNGLLDAHDCPDPSTVSPRRVVTTTPLQALSLLNNAFVLRMADRFAECLKKDAGDDTARQIGRAFELAYGRQATADEIARIRPIVEQHGLAAFCRAVLNSNEFVYVD